jgi:hypothetical protein
MTRIVVGSPNLTQPLLLYSSLGPTMLEQHRRSCRPYVHGGYKITFNQDGYVKQMYGSCKTDNN